MKIGFSTLIASTRINGRKFHLHAHPRSAANGWVRLKLVADHGDSLAPRNVKKNWHMGYSPTQGRLSQSVDTAALASSMPDVLAWVESTARRILACACPTCGQEVVERPRIGKAAAYHPIGPRLARPWRHDAPPGGSWPGKPRG